MHTTRFTLLRSSGLTALAMGSVILTASAAKAQRAAEVPVSGVIRRTISLPNGTHTIRTSNLANGAIPDPMMHIWGERFNSSGAFAGYGEVTRCDDDDGLNSICTFTRPGGWGYGNYTIVVHAYHDDRSGTADLLVNGSTIGTNLPFAGKSISVGGGWSGVQNLDSGWFHYESALALGTHRTQDTFIYGFSGFELKSMDDDGGVGFNSRLTNDPLTSFSRVIVGGYATYPFPDPVRVYANDYSADADGDGLGAGLEAALGTCDSVSTSTACADPTLCAELNQSPPDPLRLARCWKDRDRDGLDDNWEVFGVEAPSGEVQHLPAWGADPRLKDSFVELDWSDAHPYNPFLETNMAAVAAKYNPTSIPSGVDLAAVLHHPSGGIRMHFDIGTTCGNKSLCGDWGGSTAVPAASSYPSLYTTHFSGARRTVFRYAAAANVYGGQASAWPGDHMGFGNAANVITLAHEYGHLLGVGHAGHATWGDINCKPHYTSIMNYAGGWTDFSFGLNKEVLDPSNLVEQGAYATYPTQNPVPYIQRAGHMAFDWEPSSRSVNWNFFKTFEPVNVRANPRQVVSWEAECQENEMNEWVLSTPNPPANRFARDTRLVRLGTRMYAFWRTSTNFLYYAYANIPGPNAYGSCESEAAGTLQIGQTQNPCLTWSAPIYYTQGVTGFSAAAFETAAAQTVVVAHNNGVNVWADVRTPTSPSDGSLATLSNTPVEMFDPRDPEVSVMHVNPSLFGGESRVIGLFLGRAGAPYHWLTLRTPSGTWQSEGDVQAWQGSPPSIAPLPGQSIFRPAVIPWPDIQQTYGSSFAGACGVFPGPDLKAKIYCYRAADNHWRQLGSTDTWAGETCLSDNEGNCLDTHLSSAPALAYHVPRRASDGLPLENGEGMLWVHIPFDVDRDGRFYRSTRLTPTAAPWALSGTYPGLNGFLEYGMHGSIALYEDAQVSALRGMMSRGDNGDVSFLPFVDGTFKAALRDGNDFAIMERGLCRGLRASIGDLVAYCGLAFPGGL